MKLIITCFFALFIGLLFSSFSSNRIGVKIKNHDEKPFIIVSEMPQFPGGKTAMDKYITKNLMYPFEAIKHKIQGKVNVEFIVDKDGSLTEIKTVGVKIGYGLEEQALKIFNSMPKWTPGKQDGKIVLVYMMVPVIYNY